MLRLTRRHRLLHMLMLSMQKLHPSLPPSERIITPALELAAGHRTCHAPCLHSF